MFHRGTFLLNEAKRADAELQLSNDPTWIDLSLKPDLSHSVSGRSFVGANLLRPARVFLVIEYFDSNRNMIAAGGEKRRGRNSIQVQIAISGPDFTAQFRVPPGSTATRLGFIVKGKSATIRNAIEITPSAPKSGSQWLEGRQHQLLSGKYPLDLNATADVTSTLWKSPNHRISFDLIEEKDFTVSLKLQGDERAISAKSAVVWVRFFDQGGQAIPSRVPMNAGQKGEFMYLAYTGSEKQSLNIYAPFDCVKATLEFALWEAPEGSLHIDNMIEIDTQVLSHSEPGVTLVKSYTAAVLSAGLTEQSYLTLSKETIWGSVRLETSFNDFEIQLQFHGDAGALVTKAGLLRLEFHDAQGRALKSRRPLNSSQKYGNYLYLDLAESGRYTYTIPCPSTCVQLRFGLMLWKAPAGTLRVRNQLSIKPVEARRNIVTANHKSVARRDRIRPANQIKVALICDEFTYNSFKYEFSPIILEPGTWRESFEKSKPDLFFCESAWSGVDSIDRPWKGRIYASQNFANENRNELLEIIAYCQDNSIPTVFWNKEDPSHFDDRIHDFVETAKQFDIVLTTDEDCVERYKLEHGINNVYCMPFATQPRLYSPSAALGREEKIVFAGSWYENHEERSRQMEEILDEIIGQDIQLEILDRYYGTDDELHIFPTKYAEYLRPAVTHRELPEVYRGSSMGLNINTVTESSTMFARRVFELMSSNTLVISNYSRGIDQMFPGHVTFIGDGHRSVLSSVSQDQELIRDENLHEVLANHTYEDRFRQILDTCGIKYDRSVYEVAIVGIVHGSDDADRLVRTFEAHRKVTSRLLMVLGDRLSGREVAEFYLRYNRGPVEVVSQAVLRLADRSAAGVMRAGWFIIMDLCQPLSPEQVAKAILHRKYVDGPVVIGSEEKYVYTRDAVVQNLLAPRDYIFDAIMNYGQKTRGTFYHV